MYVFDTSAYINGWRDHYPRPLFDHVWELVEEAMRRELVISPREVLIELGKKDDDLFKWATGLRQFFVDPSDAVQAAIGEIYAQFPRPGKKDAGDPWVIAEARERKLAVATYEGRAFDGTPSGRALERMPGVCALYGVQCVPLPIALVELRRQIS